MFFIAQLAAREDAVRRDPNEVPRITLTSTQERQIRTLAQLIGADPQRTIDIMRNSTVTRLPPLPGQLWGQVGVTYPANLISNETHPQSLAREFATHLLSEAYFHGTTADLSPESVSRALYASRDLLAGSANRNGFLGARTTAWIRSEAQRIGVPENLVASFQSAILASAVLVDPDIPAPFIRSFVGHMVGDDRLAEAALAIGSALQTSPPRPGEPNARAEYWISHEDAVALHRQHIQGVLRAGSAIARAETPVPTPTPTPAPVTSRPRATGGRRGGRRVAEPGPTMDFSHEDVWGTQPTPAPTPTPTVRPAPAPTEAPTPTLTPAPPVVAPTPRTPATREEISLITRSAAWLNDLDQRLSQISGLSLTQKNDLKSFFQSLNRRYGGTDDRLSGLGARRINDFIAEINKGTPLDAARDFVRRMV